jgi:hypothetical protein
MGPAQLADSLLRDEQRIVNAIGVGAGWEVWMQVELAVVLRERGLQVAREVPYDPPALPRRILDALASDAAGRYAIELKVESATNAGAAVMQGVLADRVKLGYYTPAVGNRWATGIAYSDTAKHLFEAFAATPANNASYFHGQTIGILVGAV